MTQNLFSVPIFFIIFRETIEASIIISVLLSFVEQLVTGSERPDGVSEEQNQRRIKSLIKKMRVQIWAGAIAGLFIALAIGAAFIAVFYTKLSDLWAQSEALWEGIFSILASMIILVMGIAFLRMDRSRAKWRIKLQAAFADHNPLADQEESTWATFKGLFRRAPKHFSDENSIGMTEEEKKRAKAEGKGGKWALFLLPMITVLREGLEAVIFVAGVSISQPASATPIALVVGILAGFAVGFVIYRGGSAFALHTFLIISTIILFLVGAGLFSKGVGFCEYYPWGKRVGGDAAESGSGPGSYNVGTGQVVWHVNYGNPEITSNGGWMIFNAILGWNNNATYATILSYVFYWIAIVCSLCYLKWKEGRIALFGLKSQALKDREAREASGEFPVEKKTIVRSASSSSSKDSDEKNTKPLGSPDLSSSSDEAHDGIAYRS